MEPSSRVRSSSSRSENPAGGPQESTKTGSPRPRVDRKCSFISSIFCRIASPLIRGNRKLFLILSTTETRSYRLIGPEALRLQLRPHRKDRRSKILERGTHSPTD